MSFDPTVVVVGLGYIGLPTAAILASHRVRVIGVDVNPRHVAAVSRGEVPFVEPDLADHVARAVSDGMLTAQATMPAGDIFIVAVPTPFAEDHAADLSYIDAAMAAIAPVLRGGELVILESTSPPGATERMQVQLAQLRPDWAAAGQVDFAHCPERVLPGRVMTELVTNDRIIGGLTPRAADRASAVYAVFCRGDLHRTDARTAELAKLVENSFRDVNIAFANELSLICDRLGIDVWELIELTNKHPRVNVLQPGPGVGGHCIAVDPWFIVSAAPEESRLIRTAREVNDRKPGYVVERIATLADRFRAPVIGLLGLSFKADIDDLRESPALQIAAEVARTLPHARLLAVEPHIDELPPALAAFPHVEFSEATAAVAGADIVVLLVDHRDFQALDPATLAEKVVVDTRGMWARNKATVAATGAADSRHLVVVS